MKEYKLNEGASVILDLIRGVSAQIVVIGHGISFFGIFTFLHEPNFPWMQNIAVLIFFLLSGFLISYSTVRKRSNDEQYGFRQYFIERFSRIYTAFIPSIIFVCMLDLISKNMNPASYAYGDAYDVKTFIGNLFMLQDYSIFSVLHNDFITSFGSARPFWTLAIEWWIYLSFGYFMLVTLKKDKSSISDLLILSFLSIVPAYNLITGRGNGLTAYWLFGSLVYIMSTLHILKDVKLHVKIMSALIFVFLAFARAYLRMQAYDPIFAFLLAVVLWLVIDIFKDKRFSTLAIKMIKYNASFSYTLYLVHYSILDFIKSHFDGLLNPYALFGIGFITVNVISISIGRYTEISLTKKVKMFLHKKFDDKQFAAST